MSYYLQVNRYSQMSVGSKLSTAHKMMFFHINIHHYIGIILVSRTMEKYSHHGKSTDKVITLPTAICQINNQSQYATKLLICHPLIGTHSLV